MKTYLINRISRPYTMVDLHFWSAVFWIVMIPVTILWLGNFNMYISLVSVWALVVTHVSGFSSAKTEEVVLEKVDGDSV